MGKINPSLRLLKLSDATRRVIDSNVHHKAAILKRKAARKVSQNRPPLDMPGHTLVFDGKGPAAVPCMGLPAFT